MIMSGMGRPLICSTYDAVRDAAFVIGYLCLSRRTGGLVGPERYLSRLPVSRAYYSPWLRGGGGGVQRRSGKLGRRHS